MSDTGPLFPKPDKITAIAMVWDKDLECMVPKYGRNHFDYNELRSDLPCPAIRADGMDAFQSMVSGKMVDSKSAYYKELSSSGREIVGFDRDWERHCKSPHTEKQHMLDVVKDVKKSIEIVASNTPTKPRRKKARTNA